MGIHPKQHLGQRGIRGLVSLKKSFVDADTSKNGVLTYEQFATVLRSLHPNSPTPFHHGDLIPTSCSPLVVHDWSRDFGLGLSSHELRSLFVASDKNYLDRIEVNEIINALRGSLSPQREEMITKVRSLVSPVL